MPQKFLFATSFDTQAQVVVPLVAPMEMEQEILPTNEIAPEDLSASLPEAPLLTEADIEAARAAAYEEGYHAGEAAARNEQVTTQQELLEHLTEQLRILAVQGEESITQFETDAVRLAGQLLLTLAPSLAEASKGQDIIALLKQCFVGLKGEKAITLRTTPSEVAWLEDIAANLLKNEDPTNQTHLTIEADPSLQTGDCIVLWSEGRAERIRAQVETKIQALIAGYSKLKS